MNAQEKLKKRLNATGKKENGAPMNISFINSLTNQQIEQVRKLYNKLESTEVINVNNLENSLREGGFTKEKINKLVKLIGASRVNLNRLRNRLPGKPNTLRLTGPQSPLLLTGANEIVAPSAANLKVLQSLKPLQVAQLLQGPQKNPNLKGFTPPQIQVLVPLLQTNKGRQFLEGLKKGPLLLENVKRPRNTGPPINTGGVEGPNGSSTNKKLMMTIEELAEAYVLWRGKQHKVGYPTTFTNFLKSPNYKKYNISSQQFKNFMSYLKFEEENLPPNLPELSKNEQATRIQSHFRKFLARKKFTKSKEAVVKLQKGTREFLNRKQQSKAKSMQAVNLIMAANWTPYMTQRALELIRSKSAQPSVKTHAALVNRLGKNATNNNKRYLEERQKNAAFQGILGNSLEPNIKAALQSGKNATLNNNNPLYLKKLSGNLAAVIQRATNANVNHARVVTLKKRVDGLVRKYENELERQKHSVENARKVAIRETAETFFKRPPNKFGIGRYNVSEVPVPYRGNMEFEKAVLTEMNRMDSEVRNEWKAEVNTYFKKFPTSKLKQQVNTIKNMYKGGPKPQMTKVVENLTPSSGYGQKKGNRGRGHETPRGQAPN